MVVRVVRFYYECCVVCFVVGVCLLSGLREPVTHSLGGRALLFLGLLMFVVMTTVMVLAQPRAMATPWVGVMVGVVFRSEYGMARFQRTHLLVDVPDPGGISGSG